MGSTSMPEASEANAVKMQPSAPMAGDKLQVKATRMQGMVKLDLNSKGLTDAQLADLSTCFALSEDVEVLDVGRNPEITNLAPLAAEFRNLRILFAGCLPKISEFPCELLAKLPELYFVAMRHCAVERLLSSSLLATTRSSGETSMAPVYKSLCWLTLTNCKLEALPDEFGTLFPNLRKCGLTCNLLKKLPRTFPENLELIRFSDNQIADDGNISGLFRDCPRLAWTAWSGNPLPWLAGEEDQDEELQGLDNQLLSLEADLDLTIAIAEDKSTPSRAGNINHQYMRKSSGEPAKVLGQGASGIVLETVLADTRVAVKIFKEGVTSDGDPRHELNVLRRLLLRDGDGGDRVAAAGGASPPEGAAHTVQMLGLVAAPPAASTADATSGTADPGRRICGVVTRLLENYVPLLDTPSMQSIVRDVGFPPGCGKEHFDFGVDPKQGGPGTAQATSSGAGTTSSGSGERGTGSRTGAVPAPATPPGGGASDAGVGTPISSPSPSPAPGGPSTHAGSLINTITSIARQVALASQFLVSRSVFHGDLYGHNIIVARRAHSITSSDGDLAPDMVHAVLTDFGAAFAVDKGQRPDLHEEFEKNELKAWANLCEDMAISTGLDYKENYGRSKLTRLVEGVRGGKLTTFEQLLENFDL